MSPSSQRGEFKAASAVSVGLLLLPAREERQGELTTRKTRQRGGKKIIDGGLKGKEGRGQRRIEKGGPCRTVLPKPRSIVMKMAVHMTTIAAE